MQLKIVRSQRETGMMSKTVVFGLTAQVEFTPAELDAIKRYKLGNQNIYNSEASRKHLERGAAANDGTAVGSLKLLGALALASMNLNISFNSLQQGQHIECKSLEEVIAAEQAVMDACNNLKAYLDTAAKFDGSQVVIDFNAATV